MKGDHIYFFKNIENIELIPGLLVIKEQFIKNSFLDEFFVLFGLSEDLQYQKKILFSKIKKNLIDDKSYTISEFSYKFSKELNLISIYKKNIGLNLSWLEMFQIIFLIKNNEINDNSIEKAIKNLYIFNQKLKENY